MSYLFLDTETTGFQEPRLVELAYSLAGESMISHGLFCPPKKIDKHAMAIHHLTDDMVAPKILFENSPDKIKLQFLLDTNVLVSHNAAFDIKVLVNEGLKVNKALCTLQMAKRHITDTTTHQLQYLRYFLDLDCHGVAHSAEGDVQVLKALFQYFQRTIGPDMINSYIFNA